LAKISAWLSQKMVDEFRAFSPSALDRCDENGVIEKIS
jgi:hypothetical protein